MLIGQIKFFEFTGKFVVADLPKQVAEAPVILLEYRVLGRQIERPAALQRKIKIRAGKAAD
jgi:hypothetical protein